MTLPPPSHGTAGANLSAVLSLLARLEPAIERGDRAQQVAILSELIARRAPMGEQWRQLAYLAAANGELTLARTAADLLADAAGGGPAAQFAKAELFMTLGAWEEADALLRTLPDTLPDPATNAYNRGTTALNLGMLDEARDHLAKVTRLQPRSGLAWFALATATDLASEPAVADRLIAAASGMGNASPDDQMVYCYALGQAHAAREEYALAFRAYAEGARRMRSVVAYSQVDDRAAAEKAVEGYSAERIATLARMQREPTGRTTFVTGLPRSGTTLVEQILTSHSSVDAGGETNLLFLLAEELGGAGHTPLAAYLSTHGAAPLARLWQHWIDERFPVPGRVVDKTINMSRYLGLAAALLPEAPLIWMTRDPLDRAWSCFRINFSGNAQPWSYDLADIAAHFRIEDRLLAQWQQILGDRLLVVPYEALVTEPGSWIRRILAHCGLAEEPQVFAPHENARPIETASMLQVRRPINRDGIGAAAPYREFLEPFIAAYSG